MAYVASTTFRFGRDFIGADVVKIEAGEVDIEGLNLDERHIEWLLKEGLIDEIGQSATVDSADVVVVEQSENPQGAESEETVEYELEINPIDVAKRIKDKDELVTYASELNVSLDKRKSLSNMKKDFVKAYKLTIEAK